MLIPKSHKISSYEIIFNLWPARVTSNYKPKMEIELSYHFTDEHDYCKRPVSQWTSVEELNVANEVSLTGDQEEATELV